MVQLKELKKQYEFVCNEYVARFCKKQGVVFKWWVGDAVGGIAYCDDFHFTFQQIAFDINTKQPKGAIIKWYNENLATPENWLLCVRLIQGLIFKQFKIK